MDMSRRSFLKLALVATAAAVSPVSLLAYDHVPEEATILGNVRITSVYDLSWDRTMYRYDIMLNRNGEEVQYGVDMAAGGRTKPDKKMHDDCIQILSNAIEADGYSYSDLIPYPKG